MNTGADDLASMTATELHRYIGDRLHTNNYAEAGRAAQMLVARLEPPGDRAVLLGIRSLFERVAQGKTTPEDRASMRVLADAITPPPPLRAARKGETE